MSEHTSHHGKGSMIPFNFDGTEVRVLDQGGEPWWVLADVCTVLEVRNSRDAADRLDDDERGVAIIDTLGGPQGMTIINESGLWSLVLTSRKPEAKRFKKWITSEVIPAIRQTGGYIAAAPQETSEELVLRAMSVLQATIERQKKEAAEVISRQQAQIDADAPKVAALEMLAEKDGELGVRDTGRELKVGQAAVREEMFMRGWACRQGRDIRPASYGLKHGYVRLVQRVYTHPVTGQEKVSDDFRVTRKGIARLAEIFASKG